MKKNKKIYEITEKSIVLNEDEIVKIKSFIEEISNIHCVECIFILPLYSFLNKRAQASVVALYNDDEELSDETLEEINKADRIAFEYDDCDRLRFNTAYAKDYKYPINNVDELMAATRLYYSTILFDRFGNKTRIQENLLSNFNIPSGIAESWNNVIAIDNIEELIGNHNLKMSLEQ